MNALRTALRRAGWPLRTALVGLIRLYGLTLGGVVGGRCRFHPSCSAYAEEAIRELGVLRGVPVSVWRVLRCSPLSKGGVDFPPGHDRRVFDDVTQSTVRPRAAA